MKIVKVALILILAISVSPCLAQIGQPTDSAATAQTSIPTFRNRAEVVLVPVVIRDKHGKAVTGLTKDVFAIEENGKKQEISSFEEISHQDIKWKESSHGEGYSNLPLDESQRSHVTIIVLDLMNTDELQRTNGKEQLVRFLSKDLPVGEPISLLALTKKGVQLIHPFTSDPGTLIKAVQDFKVEGYTLGFNVGIAYETLKQLREISRSYAGIPGRKSLLWITGRIPYMELPGTAEGVSSTGIGTSFRETWEALLSSNIALYPLELFTPRGLGRADTRSPFAFPSGGDSRQNLRSFADATGGVLCDETNGLKRCLDVAIEDSRSYYLLSYSLASDDRKPGWRKLGVKVAAPSIQVRAREGFYYDPSDHSNRPNNEHADEITALASSLAASGVLMNVKILSPPSKRDPTHVGKVTEEFVVTIPLDGITVTSSPNPTLDLEVGAIALDAKVKDAGEFLHPVHGNLTSDKLKELARDGIHLREKLELAPGSYDVRFLVRDNPTGKIGTVVFPLEVK